MTPPETWHTPAELDAMVELLRATRPRVRAVALGHGRDTASRSAVESFARVWEAGGGHVLAVVDWPEQAASWLRPARRLAAGAPDGWVVAGAALGWARMSRRLRQSTDWDPTRTYGFAGMDDVRLVELAGPGTLDGMRGVTPEGGTWEIGDPRDRPYR